MRKLIAHLFQGSRFKVQYLRGIINHTLLARIADIEFVKFSLSGNFIKSFFSRSTGFGERFWPISKVMKSFLAIGLWARAFTTYFPESINADGRDRSVRVPRPKCIHPLSLYNFIISLYKVTFIAALYFHPRDVYGHFERAIVEADARAGFFIYKHGIQLLMWVISESVIALQFYRGSRRSINWRDFDGGRGVFWGIVAWVFLHAS